MELRKVMASNLLKKSSPRLLDRGKLGRSGASMGLRTNSFADIVQEGEGQPAMLAGHFSRLASRNSLNENLVTSGISSKHSTELQNKAATIEQLHLGKMVQGLSSVQSFSSALHSPSIRSRTLDHHLVGKSASPSLPHVDSGVRLGDGINVLGSNSLNGFSSGVNPIANIAASLAGLNMSKDQFHNRESFLDSQLQMGISDAHPQNMQLQFHNKSRAGNMAIVTNCPLLARENGFALSDLNNSSLGLNGQLNFPRMTYFSASLHSQVNDPGFTSLSSGTSIKGQSLRINAGQARSNHPTTPMDPRHVQHFHESYNHKMNVRVVPEQKQHYQSPMYGSSGLQRQYQENPTLDLCMPYQGNQMAKFVFPTVRSRTAMCQNERMPHATFILKHSVGNGFCHSETETNMEGRLASMLLEELNNKKTRSMELSNVLGHVIEFSTDQYSSRFIQQKLKTATVEEKMKIFPEIMTHARSLMIDVFRNYVIQKFFEHGTESQRNELASQLIGHVLPLSLQMYGCRVI